VLHGGEFGGRQLADAHFDAKRFPVEAANYLEQSNVHGPVLTPDSWGGYLIYRLYPREKVVVDDRHDLYGEEFLKSYLKMIHVEPGWQEFLQERKPACVVLPRDSALASILLETASWQPIYRDNLAIVFVPERAAWE
jgi:hypothetical protein